MTNKVLVVAFTLAALSPKLTLRADSENDIVSMAIGITVAQSVLLAQMSVTTVADAFGGHVYKSDQAERIVINLIAAMSVSKEELSKLLTVWKMTSEESKFLQANLATLDLVSDEAKHLKSYIGTGDKSAMEAYEQDRQKIIAQINNFRSGKR